MISRKKSTAELLIYYTFSVGEELRFYFKGITMKTCCRHEKFLKSRSNEGCYTSESTDESNEASAALELSTLLTFEFT